MAENPAGRERWVGLKIASEMEYKWMEWCQLHLAWHCYICMDSIGRFVFRFSFFSLVFFVVTNLAIFSINFNSFWKFHPLCTLHMYSRGPPIPFHLIRLGCQALIIFAWIGTGSRGRSLRCFLSSSSRKAHRRKNVAVPSMSEQRRQGGETESERETQLSALTNQSISLEFFCALWRQIKITFARFETIGKRNLCSA